ncbi:helix-turn-helix domain-containing protein [Cohnella sp. GCM10012308]|uniref:helix-turn-helix domain-containing protein n=1 Tax=Cohnella sp. GCM10012308 TaxID=3317329 RepID=UPI0036101998
MTGFSISYRIKKSCEFLESTANPITEISRRAGFNHVDHSIQSFRKHRDTTPKAYRKGLGNGNE